MMRITVTDLMRAVDELEIIGRKVFDTMEPLWDEDERMYKRAMATLHAIVREANQP